MSQSTRIVHAGTGKPILSFDDWNKMTKRKRRPDPTQGRSNVDAKVQLLVSTYAPPPIRLSSTKLDERKLVLALRKKMDTEIEQPASKRVGSGVCSPKSFVEQYKDQLNVLEELNIEDLGLTSFPEILAKELVGLTHLYASGNNFGVFPSSLTPNLQTLEHIDFGTTRFCSVYDLLDKIAHCLNKEGDFLWIELDELPNVLITKQQARCLKNKGYSLRHFPGKGEASRVAFDYLCMVGW